MNNWLADVQAVLSTTPERWQRLISTLPIDLLTRPPAVGEWSALHCLQHLLDAERLVFPVRFHAFLAGQEFVDFDPNEPHAGTESLTPEQLMAAFARARKASLVLFEQVTDDDLGRTKQHPTLGIVTLAEMLHTWVVVRSNKARLHRLIAECCDKLGRKFHGSRWRCFSSVFL